MPAEGEAGDAGGADNPAGSDEAVGLGRGVEVEPGGAALRRAIRASGSTSTFRIRERSITRPSSTAQCPAGLCPPPRTAISRPWL